MRRILLLFTGGVVFLAGCRHAAPDSDSLQVQCEIAPQPPRVGKAEVTVRLSGIRGSDVVGARVSLEGNMAHPGMGPTFGTTREVKPGAYQGTLEFTMPGDWALLLYIELPDGGKVEKQMNVSRVLGQ